MSSSILSPITLIGIAGGSASGKSTIAHLLQKKDPKQITHLSLDNYYLDLSHLSSKEKEGYNFDIPEAFNTKLIKKQFEALKSGKSIDRHTYNFQSNVNQIDGTIHPTPIILIEGILLFAMPEICNLLNIKIFVEADDDVRLARRLARDRTRSGETTDETLKQWFATVKPMHIQFVKPSKAHADIIIESNKNNQPTIDLLMAFIEKQLLYRK